MIRIEKVDKRFDDVQALKDVSLTIEDGSVYGLVGTNGSGKTTLLKLVTGVFRPDSGKITYDSEPVYENPAVKEHITFIPDELFFYGAYNLNEMGCMYRGIYDNWNEDRFNMLTDKLGLNMKKRISRFSKGMQKQAAFCLAISTMPDCLVLDEPVDGLDPMVRKLVWDSILNDVKERNMTVLVSTHNLKEIEGICSHIGIIYKGRVVLEQKLNSSDEDLEELFLSAMGGEVNA